MNTEEPIISLDVDDVSLLHIAHHSDPKTVYAVSDAIKTYSSFISDLVDSDASLLNNPSNPIVIPIGTPEAFQVFVKLFKSISDGTFKVYTLPKPFQRGKSLEELYAHHYTYFEHIVTLDRYRQFQHLREVNALANFLNIEFILVESLAVLAYHYTNATSMDEWREIKQISNSFYTTSEY